MLLSPPLITRGLPDNLPPVQTCPHKHVFAPPLSPPLTDYIPSPRCRVDPARMVATRAATGALQSAVATSIDTTHPLRLPHSYVPTMEHPSTPLDQLQLQPLPTPATPNKHRQSHIPRMSPPSTPAGHRRWDVPRTPSPIPSPWFSGRAPQCRRSYRIGSPRAPSPSSSSSSSLSPSPSRQACERRELRRRSYPRRTGTPAPRTFVFEESEGALEFGGLSPSPSPGPERHDRSSAAVERPHHDTAATRRTQEDEGKESGHRAEPAEGSTSDDLRFGDFLIATTMESSQEWDDYARGRGLRLSLAEVMRQWRQIVTKHAVGSSGPSSLHTRTS